MSTTYFTKINDESIYSSKKAMNKNPHEWSKSKTDDSLTERDRSDPPDRPLRIAVPQPHYLVKAAPAAAAAAATTRLLLLPRHWRQSYSPLSRRTFKEDLESSLSSSFEYGWQRITTILSRPQGVVGRRIMISPGRCGLQSMHSGVQMSVAETLRKWFRRRLKILKDGVRRVSRGWSSSTQKNWIFNVFSDHETLNESTYYKFVTSAQGWLSHLSCSTGFTSTSALNYKWNIAAAIFFFFLESLLWTQCCCNRTAIAYRRALLVQGLWRT